MSRIYKSLIEDKIRNNFGDSKIDDIYDIIDSNEDKLDDYKYQGWFYCLRFWKEIDLLNKENDILHQIVLEKVREIE